MNETIEELRKKLYKAIDNQDYEQSLRISMVLDEAILKLCACRRKLLVV